MCINVFPAYELTAVTEDIPSEIMQKLELKGIALFYQTVKFDFSWGAIDSAITIFLAFVTMAIGAGLKLGANKREKTLTAQ